MAASVENLFEPMPAEYHRRGEAPRPIPGSDGSAWTTIGRPMHKKGRWHTYEDCYVKKDRDEVFCVLPACTSRLIKIFHGDFSNFWKHLWTHHFHEVAVGADLIAATALRAGTKHAAVGGGGASAVPALPPGQTTLVSVADQKKLDEAMRDKLETLMTSLVVFCNQPFSSTENAAERDALARLSLTLVKHTLTLSS